MKHQLEETRRAIAESRAKGLADAEAVYLAIENALVALCEQDNKPPIPYGVEGLGESSRFYTLD